MACFRTRGYSCFGPYYPCHVWTSVSECDSNAVINPPILQSFAFLSLTAETLVASGGVVPVALNFSQGTSISSTTVGEVVLGAGTYTVNYNVSSDLGASGTNSFGLTLNGVSLPASVVSGTGIAGNSISLNNTALVTVTAPTTLRLVNLGRDAVTVSSANLYIQKIN